VGGELSAALPANSDALQQSRALSHCASPRLMRARMSIGGDARPIGLIGRPIDVTLVVILDKHRPLRLRQLPDTLPTGAGGVEDDLMATLPVGIRPGIDRIGHYLIDADVARRDPANGTAIAVLQGK
jgi:hypothetical protein